MSTVMSVAARERYLAELHVGVLSVMAAGGTAATLAVPIWYDYAPGTGVWVITARDSVKAVAMEAAGRYGIVAQSEELPYKYVSVEGPISEIRACDVDVDLLPMAVRYLGEEAGRLYTKQFEGDTNQLVYLMRPERWRSTDLTEATEQLRQSMA